MKELIIIAIPITLASSIMGLTNIADTMLFANGLQASGVSEKVATACYGTYTSMVYAFFGLFLWVGFLMFIWGIPTKKSQRWLLTLVLFTPYIVDIICPFLAIEADYRYMIVDTLQIASYGTMLYLTLKAYKAKVITD